MILLCFEDFYDSNQANLCWFCESSSTSLLVFAKYVSICNREPKMSW